MEKLIHYTWRELETDIWSLVYQINTSNFKPTNIVGLSRGGLVLGVMLSHYYECKFDAISLQFRDGKVTSSIKKDLKQVVVDTTLVVDDICDTGHTLDFIKQTLPDVKYKVATIFDNTAQTVFRPNYSIKTFDKSIKNWWICFPWELTAEK